MKNFSVSTVIIAVITIVCIIAATVLMLFGSNDRVALALTLFAFAAPIIAALIKIDEVHRLTNSTLTKLLAEVDELKKQLILEREKAEIAKGVTP